MRLKRLALLQEYFLLFLIINQSGIRKGIATEKDVSAVIKFIISNLKEQGIGIYNVFCSHHNAEVHCECKQLKTYFPVNERQLSSTDLNQSFIIGDYPSDVQCGTNADITPIYLLSSQTDNHRNEIKEKPSNF
ncbi:MAG: hypothetical protein U5K79_21260 [Cyclobacteriaceae bacterium]|nr:hypothetical protein [Cyclobacteriaceae bacterium]